MKDKVSIITTFYNCENYILKCIDSVWNQKNSDNFDIEYILIDDHSEDKTREIIDIFFKEYGQYGSCEYKIIKTPKNLGCGGARNFGIANSTGNYIMFLDADDYYINNDFVLRAYNMITEHGADIVEYGIKFIDQTGVHISNKSKDIVEIKSGHEALMKMFYESTIKFMPWTKIIKRSIVETKSYDISREFEDIRTTPFWVYNSNYVIIMNSIEINYRMTEKSIIRDNILETRIGTVEAIASLFEYFKDDKEILKSMYDRCLVDLRIMLQLKFDNEYFKKLSKLNTYMLSFIFPDKYTEITYDID